MFDLQLGPIAVWVGALGTFSAATVALAAGLGWLSHHSRPILQLSFDGEQPWTRRVRTAGQGEALWVRLAVENHGSDPANGCIGRLIGLTTDGTPRADIDPVQLRWAGVPRSRSFMPIALRRGQREYLNVVYRPSGQDWQIDTFSDKDFDPGFETHLRADRVHDLRIALFSDNADVEAISLRLEMAEDKPVIQRV